MGRESEPNPVLSAWRAGALAGHLEKSLRDVVGSGFVHLGRTLDMIELGFGPDVLLADSTILNRWLPAHVFHVQCPFRLDDVDRTLVGSRDVYTDTQAGGSLHPDGDFGPQADRSNAFDAAAKRFFDVHPSGSLRCTGVTADNSGGIALSLDGGYVARVFPNASHTCEFWRYFRPDTTGDDLVVFNDEGD